jgi:hypothetical protein
VKWQGFTHEENNWKSYDNILENTYELLEQFDKKNLMMERDGRFRKKELKKLKHRRTRKNC